MTVTEAVQQRISVRAFTDRPVSGEVVREILQAAAKTPSGGNLQPWRVHALAGEPLAAFKAIIAGRLGQPDGAEYDVYPPNLWEPFRTRRFQCGEDLYGTLGIPREDKIGRMRQFGGNADFFGAPAGLFFSLDRKLGPPQWADLGMYMQTVMLLAQERGLGTCAQEFWSIYAQTVAKFLDLPEDHMLFAGMALGWPDEEHPVNTLRTRRDPFEAWAELRGFEG